MRSLHFNELQSCLVSGAEVRILSLQQVQYSVGKCFRVVHLGNLKGIYSEMVPRFISIYFFHLTEAFIKSDMMEH